MTPAFLQTQIDFGFSRIFNPGVPMTAMHGTVYYVSPEVMDGCYEEKCDIWSIGVIVYMLLSGSPPFNGSYDHEILVKIKRGWTFVFVWKIRHIWVVCLCVFVC